jgi:hypothetical protein
MPSYHDVRVSTSTGLDGARIFDLPYGVELACTRVTGWQLRNNGALLGGEYDGDQWLVIEVDGKVIVDSRRADQPGS